MDDIVSYIAEELSNSKAASAFVDTLQKSIEETCSFPDSGSFVVNDFLPDMGVRKKLVGSYIMYYMFNLEEKTIFVLRIVYGRRNMDEILRQLD